MEKFCSKVVDSYFMQQQLVNILCEPLFAMIKLERK